MSLLQLSAQPIKVGTMMVQEGLLGLKPLLVETDAFSRGWQAIRVLDSYRLDDALKAVGYHLFFVAGQIRTVAFGRGGRLSVRNAVRRIGAKVSALKLNCLEVTEIKQKHFLGVPYIAVSAHSYHIQEGYLLENIERR